METYDLLTLLYAYLKVMCFLEHLLVESTTQVFLKDGLEYTGGMDVLSFFLSQHLEYLLHWQHLSELVRPLL